jgi:hypothetical protein
VTIQEAILKRLSRGETTMDGIDSAVIFSDDLPQGSAMSRPTIRARVYELLKAGKVIRVRRGVYALPKAKKF